MTTLVVALVLAWVLLIGLTILVVALLRQVGMLHERLGPVGALTLPAGPKVGDQAPVFELEALDGHPVTIGRAEGQQSTLLFFLAPSCPICKSLLPVIKSLAREYGEKLKVVLASDGDMPAQRDMIEKEGLQRFPLVLSTPLGIAYEVSKLPHAVLIDEKNQIVAKGLVNNREHLESLFEAQALGIASLQKYLDARHHAASSIAETGNVP